MWRLALLIFLIQLQAVWAERVQIVTWNLKWFPGGGPTSTPVQRALHVSEAKDALLALKPDILCIQELRDWENFAELTSVLPSLKPLIVSRHRDSPFGGPISIQQIGIAAIYPAESSWSEAFKPAPDTPPRGFAFAAFKVERKSLLVYSVHLKSNMGDIAVNIAKREEAMKQLHVHVANMEKIYGADSVVVICGDFNTDPTDARFAEEKTFSMLEAEGFKWPWLGVALEDRVTLPASGRFPDASFDGFLIKGDVKILKCQPIKIEGVSDHYPVMLEIDLP